MYNIFEGGEGRTRGIKFKVASRQRSSIGLPSLFPRLGNYCPICLHCYEDNDYESKMMQCAKCDHWVHAKCEGLSGGSVHVSSMVLISCATITWILRSSSDVPWKLAAHCTLISLHIQTDTPTYMGTYVCIYIGIQLKEHVQTNADSQPWDTLPVHFSVQLEGLKFLTNGDLILQGVGVEVRTSPSYRVCIDINLQLLTSLMIDYYLVTVDSLRNQEQCCFRRHHLDDSGFLKAPGPHKEW